MTKTASNINDAAGPPVDSRSILKWLESPLAPHPAEELPTLRAHLAGLRHAAGGLQQRAIALDGLYARASAVVDRILPTLVEGSLPVAAKTRRVVRSIIDLLQVMAEETLALVDHLDPQHQPSLHQPSLSPTLALWRSLQASAQQLMISHLIAAPPRVGTWQQLHQTYATAQRLHLAATVPDGLNTSLQHVYHAAVLLGCADPASLTPPEIMFLASYFERFADHIEPASAASAALHGTFWIDPTRDLPASSSLRKAAPAAEPLEYFSCARLCLLINNQISSMEAGTPARRLDLSDFAESPAGLGVLRRLVDRWSGSGKRRFQRRRQNTRTFMAAGLDNLWQVCQKRDGASAELSTWMITNESANGYAVMHLSGKTAALSVGGVVAVRTGSEDDWQICIVRWAVSENPEHLELGLQILAPSAVAAVLAQPSESKGTEYLRVLVLPEIPRLRSAELLVVASGAVAKPQSRLVLVIESENVAVREVNSIHVDEQTMSVDILSIEPDQDSNE